MALAVVIAIAVIIIVGLFILRTAAVRRAQADRERTQANREEEREKYLYKQLLARLLGDRKAADRLIEIERERLPDASTATVIQAAIDRLEYDRQSWRT